MQASTAADRVLARIERETDELVELAAGLMRIPTVNPPGELYRECAEWIGARLEEYGFEDE